MILEEWEKHIMHEHVEKEGLTLCGERFRGFAFQGVDHAFMEREREGRLLICPACLKVAIDTLNS